MAREGHIQEPESVRLIYKGIVVMTNKIKSSKEQGQAIMEMCICLVPILVVLLGMIFVSGLGIANIRAFIDAKENAEIASRYSNAVGGSGNNIYYWDYGDPDDEGDGYPFTDDDQIINFYQANAENSMDGLMHSQLNDSAYSDSQNPNMQMNEQYIFMATSSFTSNGDNFAQTPPSSMLVAADLVEGKADSNFNDTFFDLSEFSANGSGNFNILGIEFESIDLRNMRANTVYYPAMPTQGQL